MARIILIDDEDAVRRTSRLALERAGHQVLEASDGEAGLKLLAQSGADLVITDIFMPGQDDDRHRASDSEGVPGGEGDRHVGTGLNWPAGPSQGRRTVGRCDELEETVLIRRLAASGPRRPGPRFGTAAAKWRVDGGSFSSSRGVPSC